MSPLFGLGVGAAGGDAVDAVAVDGAVAAGAVLRDVAGAGGLSARAAFGPSSANVVIATAAHQAARPHVAPARARGRDEGVGALSMTSPGVDNVASFDMKIDKND